MAVVNFFARACDGRQSNPTQNSARLAQHPIGTLISVTTMSTGCYAVIAERTNVCSWRGASGCARGEIFYLNGEDIMAVVNGVFLADLPRTMANHTRAHNPGHARGNHQRPMHTHATSNRAQARQTKLLTQRTQSVRARPPLPPSTRPVDATREAVR